MGSGLLAATVAYWLNMTYFHANEMGSRVTEYSSLEQVQRRAAWFSYCKYERTASVTSMLNDLKWESLETRRNSQRLTMFYRMQLNMVSITPAE